MKTPDQSEQVSTLLAKIRIELAELRTRLDLAQHIRQSLSVNDTLFKAIVESQTELICRFKPDMILTFVNHSYCRYFRKQPAELLGTSFLTLIPESEHDQIRAKLSSFSLDQPLLTYEHPVEIGYGEIGWQQWTDRAIFDDQGQIIEFQSVGRDITERKMAEEALRDSEEKFSRAFNSGPSAMIITTFPGGRLVEINDNCCAFLGFSRSEMVGRKISNLNIWANPTEALRLYKRIKRNSYVENEECIFITRSGEHRMGLLSAQVYTLRDQSYVITTVADITELSKLRQYMAHLDRLNLVGEIAAGIGHELRNPMTSVRGFLQLLREKPTYQEDREHFDLMIEELDRANTIITEFLALARNKVVQLEKHNLNDIVATMCPLLQAEAYMKDRYIVCELSPVPDLLLDEREIRQLLLNLVQNGLESMLPGGHLRIRTYVDESTVILAIDDQGEGINARIAPHIGTPFFTTKKEGTGLGLPICYGIAARHKAVINFETTPAGTTFYVRFALN